MGRIKVNFNMGGLRVDQGEIKTEVMNETYQQIELKEMMNNNKFIMIYNKFDEPILYNTNNITWICIQNKNMEV